MQKIKNIFIFIFIFVVFIINNFNVLAYTDADIQNATALIQTYKKGDEETEEIKHAAQVIRSNPSSVPTDVLIKAQGVCLTTFCGRGLREGLDMTKPNLQGTGITTSDSLIKVILGLVRFALPFSGIFAFVGCIYGGFLYITSFAEDQTEKAKKILVWSGLGLIVIFIAYPLVATLIKFS